MSAIFFTPKICIHTTTSVFSVILTKPQESIVRKQQQIFNNLINKFHALLWCQNVLFGYSEAYW